MIQIALHTFIKALIIDLKHILDIIFNLCAVNLPQIINHSIMKHIVLGLKINSKGFLNRPSHNKNNLLYIRKKILKNYQLQKSTRKKTSLIIH